MDHDIIAEFNTDADWWYSNSNKEITSDQYDFEFVVAHELLHGLGFISGYVDHSEALQLKPDNVLAPQIVPDTTKRASTTGSIYVKGFQPPTVYDQFLAKGVNGPTIASLFDGVSFQFNAKYADFVLALSSDSGSAGQAVQNAYAYSTSGQMVFQTLGGTSIPKIYSPSTFNSGSSLSHVDTQTYSNTANFLMVHAVGLLTGKTLTALTAKYNMTTVLGPSLQNIMNTLGWDVVGTGFTKNQVSLLYIGDRVDNDSSSSFKLTAGVWLVVFMLLVA
jgi:hypothetical protein